MEYPATIFPYRSYVSWLLTFIRIIIGWHFLYEGIVKLLTPSWTSGIFLLESRWLLSGFFQSLALNPHILNIVDFLNIWGLILIGAGLFFGLFTRVAASSGAFLLLLYYLAHPPFIGLMDGIPLEGNYLWVNKNLIEMAMLILLAIIPQNWMFGIDNLIEYGKERKANVSSAAGTSGAGGDIVKSLSGEARMVDRRMVIRNLVSIPVFGSFIYALLRNYTHETARETLSPHLQRRADAVTGASQRFETFASLSELKEKVPTGKIGNLEVSRLIIGGNLVSGIAHARDLTYVGGLLRKYLTTEKIMETLKISEACGINSALIRTDTNTVRLLHQYWRQGGKLQWIAQVKLNPGDENITLNAQAAIDSGASAIYIQGDNSDEWVHEGRFDLFDQWFARFGGKGIPVGVGCHELDVVEAMEARGYPVDFYMKTIHDTNYWSYRPDLPKVRTIINNHDNYWCREPERTARFMETVTKPWIGFKVLAAGAITPEHGFKFAFESGADFICVGMLDYQVVQDCNILTDVLKGINGRKRRLFA
jgi:uncharacterized membrane protein YphA (DoxX/SURF4 family)